MRLLTTQQFQIGCLFGGIFGLAVGATGFSNERLPSQNARASVSHLEDRTSEFNSGTFFAYELLAAKYRTESATVSNIVCYSEQRHVDQFQHAAYVIGRFAPGQKIIVYTNERPSEAAHTIKEASVRYGLPPQDVAAVVLEFRSQPLIKIGRPHKEDFEFRGSDEFESLPARQW